MTAEERAALHVNEHPVGFSGSEQVAQGLCHDQGAFSDDKNPLEIHDQR
jgi:hypothetical protein